MIVMSSIGRSKPILKKRRKKGQLLFLHLKRNIYRKLITYFLSTQSISLIVSPKYSDRNNILDQHKIGLSTGVSRNIEIP